MKEKFDSTPQFLRTMDLSHYKRIGLGRAYLERVTVAAQAIAFREVLRLKYLIACAIYCVQWVVFQGSYILGNQFYV